MNTTATALNTVNQAPTVAPMQNSVNEPVEVIVRKDAAGALCLFLKKSYNMDKFDGQGSLMVWHQSKGKNLVELPYSYYEATTAVSEEAAHEFAQRFVRDFGAPLGYSLKKRVAKNRHNAHMAINGAPSKGIVETQQRLQNERSTDSSNDELQLKMQVIMQSLPSAIGLAIQAAMTQSVLPAITVAVQGVVKAVMEDGNNNTQH